MPDWSSEVRGCVASLRRQPAFAATAMFTLALGVGVTAALFSVVYGVLLKPLPFAEPDGLVSLRHRAPGVNIPVLNHGPATWFTYRANQKAFDAMGAWEANEVAITGRGDPEQVDALSVTASTMPLLRVQPLFGRLFGADDDAPGRPLRAVLTHGYWQRRFGGDTQAIGRVLQIDGRPAEIVGILPASFSFLGHDYALLLPMQLDPATATQIGFDFQVIARLRPGVTIAQADADIARMIPLLPASFAPLKMQAYVRPLLEDVIGDVGRILWMLLAAVGVILVMACANVANLSLIRLEGRQQELATRAALGAGRGRLARTLLVESLLLALGGGLLGLAFAAAAIALLRQLAPAQLPRLDEIEVNALVVLFTIVVSLLSGLLFGVVTALRASAPSLAALRDGGRTASDASGRQRTRHVLVVAQIALALLLMIVSGLMVRTFLAMRDVRPGFTQPEQVQTFRLAIPPDLIADPVQVARTFEQIAQHLSALPGVQSVGVASSITMDGEDNANPLRIEEFPPPEGQFAATRRFKSFGPGYFETMGNRLVAGRSLAWAEIYQRLPVVLVSETLAREYWGEPSRALGKRVAAGVRHPWREIIGVVGDERDDGLNRPATAIAYFPMLNDSYQRRTMSYAVRSTRVGTPGFLRELQQAVWAVNPQLPFAAVQTLEEIQARSMAQTSFTMVMLAIAATVSRLDPLTALRTDV